MGEWMNEWKINWPDTSAYNEFKWRGVGLKCK
jgi:hypothetical protein